MDLTHGHLVGFYETEPFLVDLVVQFATYGLDHGEAVVVIASPQHHDAIRAGLAAGPCDLVAADHDGRLVMVDANTTRRALMPHGVLDHGRFRTLAEEMLDRAGARGRPVRIFGYMTALLWDDGDVAAALELEELWNELATRYDFELLCAFHMSSFGDSDGDHSFRALCDLHSAVSNESYAHLGDLSDGGSPVVVLERDEQH